MNTRKYRRFFKSLADGGEIPQKLYAELETKIAEEGGVNWNVYRYFLDGLEKRGLFEVEGTPFSTKKSAKTDGTFVYKRPKNPFWHIGHAVTSTVFKFLGWLASGLVYGAWRIPDRKKLKAVKGASISVSNHIGYIDAALTRYAFGCRKQNIIVAPHNCKKTFGGMLLKSATVVPLPITFRGAKPFCEMLEYLVRRGGDLHFYAEKSMWLRYEKPRPLYGGAFHYADRLDVPIVPMLYCVKPAKGLRKLLGLPRAEVRIGEPLYIDRSMPPRRRQEDLKMRTEAAMKELYEQFYGKPLVYSTDFNIGVSDDSLSGSESAPDARISAAAIKDGSGGTETGEALACEFESAAAQEIDGKILTKES